MSIVIVGANVAGGRAAETLRQEGYNGPITLIGEEPDRPYERPPLSKEYLASDNIAFHGFLRDIAFYNDHDITLMLGTKAIGLDTAAREVVLEGDKRVGFDKLLIATGSAVRELDVPGINLNNVFYLRNLDDATRLREALGKAKDVVVIGGGFIGAEVAATSRGRGLNVTLIESLSRPMIKALGPKVGAAYADIHTAHGVNVLTNAQVVEFEGVSQVRGVKLKDGTVIPADIVVVGVGVVPAVDWLEGSGIAIENGVLVDAFCQTNVPGIYAAGDVARWWHPVFEKRIRVEHLDNAGNQGVAAARAMLHKGEIYAPIPFVWSDQYDLKMQYVGHASGDDEVVLRGSPKTVPWSAFYLRDGRLVAALAMNRFKDIPAARRLIEKRVLVDPAVLADEASDLRAYSRQA